MHADQGHVPSLIRFLRAGLDPHRGVSYLDERGRLSGDEKMLKILLEAEFSLDCKANGGSPALDELHCGRTPKQHV